MNREKMVEIRDLLMSLPDERVNMLCWLSRNNSHAGFYWVYKYNLDGLLTADRRTYLAALKCGTAACVAGHVVLNEYAFHGMAISDEIVISTAAERILGLTDDQSDQLFLYVLSCNSSECSKRQAIARMNYMLMFGPDWITNPDYAETGLFTKDLNK